MAFAITTVPVSRNQNGAPTAPIGNALPIRLSADPEQSVLEFFDQIARIWKTAEQTPTFAEHQLVSDAAIANPARQCWTSIHSIPYTAGSYFAGQANPVQPLALGPVEDLIVHFRESDDSSSLRFELEANSDHYTTDALEKHQRRLIALLGRLDERAQHAALRSFSIIDAEERRTLIDEFNNTARPISDAILPELFEAQAARTPDNPAVVYGNISLSYDQLNRQANRLAHYLRSIGVGPDVPVAVYLNRSVEMMVAVLGILKAGGVYVPLDSSLPEKRLQFLARDAACKVALTAPPYTALLRQWHGNEQTSLQVIDLDVLQLRIARETDLNPEPTSTPDNLAYVLYTSGSTGQPKGVEMPHRALMNLIDWQCSTSAMQSGNRTLQFANLGFDVSFQEIFSTWASGGTLVLIAEETRKDPAALLRVIAETQIDRLFLPFVMLERLAEIAMDPASPRVQLKEVIIAGEQLRIGPSIRRFFGQMPGCNLWNHYGPTEAHVVTAYLLEGNPANWPDLPSIGRPLNNCEIHLLDNYNDLVPQGGVGELCIGGVCLARGYRNRPELTAERFVPHPFKQGRDNRLYKTGDLARWQSDGTIEFLGRADHQVKIRGFRVEPGEIESVLTEQPSVAQATVIARDDGYKGRHLVAYLVPAPNCKLDTSTIRREIAKRLPTYMVPTAMVVLNALPLTPNGKVDRQALPAPQSCHHELGDASVIPRNPIEHELATIWKKVFNLPVVGVRDNFFELGGHSLLAVQLVNEINRALNVELRALELFQCPTIEELARTLKANKQIEREPKIIQLRPGRGSSSLIFIYQEGGLDEFRLAHLLEHDAPLFATVVPMSESVMQRATANQTARLPTLEELAAVHVRLIQDERPHGPCMLAGHSFNGLLAYEIARQLQLLGRKIESIFLLDTEVGYRPAGWVEPEAAGRSFGWWFKNRLPFHIRNARVGGLGYFLKRIKVKFLAISRRWTKSAPAAGPALQARSQVEENTNSTWKALENIYDPAARQYRPQPIETRGILFRVRETLSGIYFSDRSLGWEGNFQQGLEIIEVSGNHFSMLETPHVNSLAKQLSFALARITTRRQEPAKASKVAFRKLMHVSAVKILEMSDVLECAESLVIC